MTCGRHRNKKTLDTAVREIANELLAKQPYGNQRYIYAPHIVLLVQQLIEAYEDAEVQPIRSDVYDFAILMQEVMNAKDAEKGKVDDNLSYFDALGRIQSYMKIFCEQTKIDHQYARRILIHIANYAMIAENKLGTSSSESESTQCQK